MEKRTLYKKRMKIKRDLIKIKTRGEQNGDITI